MAMPAGNEHSEGSAAANGPVGAPPAIPDHILLRRIGKGSYGEIWLARCALGAHRAVKVVYRHTFTDARPYEREFSGIKRFEPISREHEGLVDILHVGRNDEAGFFYYVMELADDATEQSGATEECGIAGKVAGLPRSEGPRVQHSSTSPLLHLESYVPRTLAREIKERGPLPADAVLRMSVALAEGLEYLHSRGLVHRDLKPSNIIFVGDQPKLADVGLVAELGEPQSLVGTAGFIAPEGPGTAQADIFSLGKVLYEVLTGKDREQFPELPTHLESEADESRFLELNEVVLKACAKGPRDRYRSAGEMLADLEFLQDGRSLRGARIRRQKILYGLRAAAIILGATVVSGLVWVANRSHITQAQMSKPQVLFTDDFDSRELDRDKWVSATKEWLGRDNTGRRDFRVVQTNSELWIEARAQPENDWTTCGAAWVDSKRNFREYGDCRLEVELSGRNLSGFSILSMSGGQAPLDPGDPAAVRLLALHEGEENVPWNAPAPVVHESVRIDLLASHQAAVIYPDARIIDQFRVINLASLAEWRLRFYVKVESSALVPNAIAVLRVKKITVWREPAANTIIGHIADATNGSPVGEAIIKDYDGARLAQALPNGDFKLTADAWPARIQAEHPGFAPSDLRTISGDERRRGPVSIELYKQSNTIGDVVRVIPYTNVNLSAIGFVDTNLWAIALEGNGDASQSVLMRVDLGTNQPFSPVRRFQVGEHPIRFFAQCGGRILATSAWPGGIHDLTAAEQTLLLSPKSPSEGRPIKWPIACAFDGQFLWFVENDPATNWFGLRAVDLERLEIKHSLWSPDNAIYGLAWDGGMQQFWVSSLKGRVYAIRRDTALREGTLESSRVKEFGGNYTSLAFGAGHLWGLDVDKKQLCKIKIRE